MLISEIEASVQGREELENVFEEEEKSKKGRGRTLKEVWKIVIIQFFSFNLELICTCEFFKKAEIARAA